MTVDFQNFERAFIAKTDNDLHRAYQLFDLMGNQVVNKILTTATRFFILHWTAYLAL